MRTEKIDGIAENETITVTLECNGSFSSLIEAMILDKIVTKINQRKKELYDEGYNYYNSLPYEYFVRVSYTLFFIKKLKLEYDYGGRGRARIFEMEEKNNCAWHPFEEFLDNLTDEDDYIAELKKVVTEFRDFVNGAFDLN